MDFGNFSITKREIIFSVVILAVMLVFGFLIHGAIDDALMLKHQEYNTALRIDGDADMFSYAMQTNIGNSYVHGTITTVDPVPCFEVGGEYSYVEKIKERYTRHTRTVTETYVVNGKTKTRTRTEVYWTWDRVDSWFKHCDKITFLTVEFDYGAVPFPSSDYITTIQESSKIRYKYYGAPTECMGTIYTDLRNNTINNSRFFTYTTIDEALEIMTSRGELVIFWVFWVALTGFAVYGFIYMDNYWLEDSHSYKRRGRKRW